ncbi:N-acetylmuramoyl-L-alanine amidase [Clostridium botulinum]|nr:N-acetylmuramoyl-L-alanine amidase [Clostridium botulinum]
MNIIDVGLKFNSNIQYGNKPEKIVLHHAEASNCTVQDIHSWHKNNRWAGIGYHYYVRKDGSIYEGRKDDAIGSHCQGNNTNTLGICFEGNYMKENMPQSQFNSGVELIKYLKNKYGTLYIYGHKDLMSTDCPGKNFPLDNFKNLKESKTIGYVVTNYFKNGYHENEEFEGIDLEYVLSYFKGIRCYMRHDSKGQWIETQTLPYSKCLKLKETLGSWFYKIK